MSEAETIARSLSKAQRDAILGRRTLSSGVGMWPLRNALARKGLYAGLPPRITDLGLAVRAVLTEPAPGGGA